MNFSTVIHFNSFAPLLDRVGYPRNYLLRCLLPFRSRTHGTSAPCAISANSSLSRTHRAEVHDWHTLCFIFRNNIYPAILRTMSLWCFCTLSQVLLQSLLHMGLHKIQSTSRTANLLLPCIFQYGSGQDTVHLSSIYHLCWCRLCHNRQAIFSVLLSCK